MNELVPALADVLAGLDFNLADYRRKNPDLAPLGESLDANLDHWLTYGLEEGRILSFDIDRERAIAFARSKPALPRGLHRHVVRSVVANALEKKYYQPPAAVEAENLIQIQSVLAFSQFGFSPYLVVGDSHSFAYTLPWMATRDLLPVWFACLGASARGLVNPQSRSGYGAMVKSAIEGLDRRLAAPIPAIFCFGQVDVEFVYYYKLIQDGLPHSAERVTQFIAETVARYVAFLVEIGRYRKLKVHAAVIFPPCLYDETIRAGYINGRIVRINTDADLTFLTEQVKTFDFPSLRERTDIHRQFNARLREACRDSGIPVIDLFDDLLRDGVADERYMVEPKGKDHHLHFNAFNRLIHERIRPLVRPGLLRRLVVRRRYRGSRAAPAR